MNIGSLVEYSGNKDESMGRVSGVIIGMSVYHRSSRDMKQFAESIVSERIVEVLWNTGPGWILQSRGRLIDEVG